MAALNNDREVLDAVHRDGMELKHSSDALQNDKEVVLVAVNENGRALEYASAALKNDKEVVLAAVKQGVSALRWASAALYLFIFSFFAFFFPLVSTSLPEFRDCPNKKEKN